MVNKAKELRDFSVDELKLKLIDARKDLFELKNDARLSSNGGSHEIPLQRKHIARLLTVLREKAAEEKVSHA